VTARTAAQLAWSLWALAMLEDTDTVYYDVERRVLMFGVAKVGD
jgi:hypothetical protein